MFLSRTLIKYLLLQIPELALLLVILLLARNWVDMPAWLIGAIVAAWIAKDAAMYPVYRKALAADSPADRIVGARGVARERIDPCGYILVRGELWRACLREGATPVAAGTTVRVTAMEGLTLEIVVEHCE